MGQDRGKKGETMKKVLAASIALALAPALQAGDIEAGKAKAAEAGAKMQAQYQEQIDKSEAKRDEALAEMRRLQSASAEASIRERLYACCSASWSCSLDCSEMSRAILETPTIPPLASRTGEIVSDTSMIRPSLVRR